MGIQRRMFPNLQSKFRVKIKSIINLVLFHRIEISFKTAQNHLVSDDTRRNSFSVNVY